MRDAIRFGEGGGKRDGVRKERGVGRREGPARLGVAVRAVGVRVGEGKRKSEGRRKSGHRGGVGRQSSGKGWESRDGDSARERRSLEAGGLTTYCSLKSRTSFSTLPRTDGSCYQHALRQLWFRAKQDRRRLAAELTWFSKDPHTV
eukprot:3705076-Rhodomonas_salina.1